MRSREPSIPMIVQLFSRAISSGAMIICIVALVAVIRGVVEGISYPLVSDDWYLVACFITVWCWVPAILTFVFNNAHSKIARVVYYSAFSLLQVMAFYAYCFFISAIPNNELSSSPLILMVYAAIPIAVMFYPLFFIGEYWGRARKWSIIIAVLLMAYAMMIS